MMSLREAANLAHGILVGEDVHCTAVNTDSRTLQAGELFVALQGEHFDGHAFLPNAAALGAAGAMVSRAEGVPLPAILVEDTLLALGKLGRGWRQKFSMPLIGVTGSNGKTTLKEMLASILSLQGATLATMGNLNNQIGVPMTLLRLGREHRFAVIEMGTSNPGEIAYLANLALPTIGIVTNASAAHLLGLGSVAAVAKEKGALFEALPEQGVAILNADDAHFPDWRQLGFGGKKISFGFSEQADVRAPESSLQLQVGTSIVQSFVVQHQGESIPMQLPLLGKHNVRNALAAIAACRVLGLGWETIQAGLATLVPAKGRLYPMHLSFGILLDDSYNANPLSFMAGIDALCSLSGEPWLVMGDMGELGETSALQHAKVVEYALAKGAQRLFVLGAEMSAAVKGLPQAQVFASHEALAVAVAQALKPGVNLLVKGSRFMAMESVIAKLQAVEVAACC